MKQKISIIVLLSFLGLVAAACSVSFTTAKMDSFNLGKNEKVTPPVSSFEAGEQIYAVATVSGLMSKHTVKFKVTSENVPDVPKGLSAFEKSLDVSSAGPAGLALSIKVPGEYKIEATMVDDSGKEIDKKSAIFSVKGGAPAPAAAAPASDDDADKDSDDK